MHVGEQAGNPQADQEGKGAKQRGRCHICRGPEANRVEGAAKKVGKGLEGQAKTLGLDSVGPEGSQVSEQGRDRINVWAKKMQPSGHSAHNGDSERMRTSDEAQ